MRIFHVVAVANRGVIGKANALPWHFKPDLKHFKTLTLGGTVIMGRRTYESIGKRLPGRENFVLSRTVADQDPVRFFPSIEAAVKAVRTDKAFIIGGETVYRTTFGIIDGIYLSRIYADFEGDAFYPEIPEGFAEISRETLQQDPCIEVIFYEKRSIVK